MCTAILADLAQMNVKSALNHDNRPSSAVLYSWMIVDNDFNKFRCMLRRYSRARTIEYKPRPLI